MLQWVSLVPKLKQGQPSLPTLDLVGALVCRLITARATANQLLLLRLVFHPIIWGIMSLLFQHTARWIGAPQGCVLLAQTVIVRQPCSGLTSVNAQWARRL